MKTFLSLIPLSALTLVAAAADLPSQSDVSLLQEVTRSRDRAMTWLLQQQDAGGSWRNHPAITGLAITALARSGRPLTKEQQETLDRGVKFILSNVQTNGAIYSGGKGDEYPNYSTAICAMALLATGKPEVMDSVRKARHYLLGSQFDEGEGYTTNNPSYGGIGYGKRERPDMSNTQLALEAIRLTESLETQASEESPHTGTRLHWKKAIEFLQHCQNSPAVNDQPWARKAATNDVGGFIYMPGDPAKKLPPLSFADDEVAPKDGTTPLRSYGSMTYAGLKSYLYAELKKDDPRVKAAVEWLKHNYTLDENPGLGAQGLFYYYHTVAKALTVYGDDTFTDAAGKVHDWRYEMMKKFVTHQKADGYWQNDNNRWWENDPVLCTSYSLIALEILQARRYP
jgi:squalene-hopene/tetraprenyl-beta-curcumene cyclase